jgi:hypothetical protein
MPLLAGGGVCCGLFVPFFAISTNDSFHLLHPGTLPLTVYTANW